METELNLLDIYKFAKEKTEWQFRRDGVTPYFNHPEAVAKLLDSLDDKAIAYCHDLLEDNRCEHEELSNVVWQDIYEKILSLTKTKGLPYQDYINKIPRWLIHIKIADIVTNLSDDPTPKQSEKYYKALCSFLPIYTFHRTP